MNFYLLLPVSIKIDNSIDPILRCRILHVFQRPDKKSYNIYSYGSYLFNWPRKKISKSFIEKVLDRQRYLWQINGNSIEELVDRLREPYGDIPYYTIIE